MYMKNGIVTSRLLPKPATSTRRTPNVVTHQAQRTPVIASTRRLDNLLKGKFRICVQRTLGGIGDIIMATPVFRAIKRKHPEAHTTFSIPSSYAGGDVVELLKYNPYIDEIRDFSLVNRDDYDAFADITRTGLQEEIQANHTMVIPKNRIDLFAEAAGVPLGDEALPVYVMTPDEEAWGKEWVDREAGSIPQGKRIAVHLRSNDPKRTWHRDSLRSFLALAAERGYRCFLFGWGDNPDEWRVKGTTLVFNFKFRQEAAILRACDVLVCPDSHMLHLGGALNMKMVSLFGSMPPACRINHYPNCVAIVNEKLSCLGCIYSSCPNNFYCMRSIPPERVMEATKAQLSNGLVPAKGVSSLYTPQEVSIVLPELKPTQL